MDSQRTTPDVSIYADIKHALAAVLRARGNASTVPACLALLNLTHDIRTVLNQIALESGGITLEQATLLCVLDLSKDPTTIVQVSRMLRRAHHTISERAKDMEKAGFVTRSKHASRDGRQVLLKLTPKGRRCLERYRVAAAAAIAPLT